MYADGAAPLIQRFLVDIEGRVLRPVQVADGSARRRA